MLNNIKKYRQSEFFRNVFKLSSSTTLAQIIAISCAPFLYRIYEREDYGLLGLFMATTGVVSVFSTFQYLNTIMIVKNEKEVWYALTLNRLLNIGLSTVILIIVVALFIFSPNILSIRDFGWYFLLVPISIFLNGQNQIFRVFANRKKAYDVIMINTILIAIVSPLLSIPLGLMTEGPLGLFISLLSGQIFAYFFLQYRLKTSYDLSWSEINFRALIAFAKEYSNFPKFILPTEFVGIFARKLPVFMINNFFGLEWLGVYNLAVRMLGLPSELLSNSIGEVFKQKVSEQINEKNEAVELFKNTFLALLLIASFTIIVIMLTGPWLFSYFFGEKWLLAGDLSKVLIWLFSFQIIASPLSFLFVLRNRMQETLICHLYILLSSYFIFNIMSVMNRDIIDTLLVYVINYCSVYAYYLIRSYKFANDYEG